MKDLSIPVVVTTIATLIVAFIDVKAQSFWSPLLGIWLAIMAFTRGAVWAMEHQ